MAVGLASCLAEREPCWLVDVHGGAAAVLGVDRMPVGLAEWSAAPEAPDDALTRLTREVAPGLGLLGPGSGAVGPELDVRRLRAELVTVGPTVIVDVGTHPRRRPWSPLRTGRRWCCGTAPRRSRRRSTTRSWPTTPS